MTFRLDGYARSRRPNEAASDGVSNRPDSETGVGSGVGEERVVTRGPLPSELWSTVTVAIGFSSGSAPTIQPSLATPLSAAVSAGWAKLPAHCQSSSSQDARLHWTGPTRPEHQSYTLLAEPLEICDERLTEWSTRWETRSELSR